MLKVQWENDQYQITDEAILTHVNTDYSEIYDQASTVEPHRISYNDLIKALEISMKYIEQQEEALWIGILLLQS